MADQKLGGRIARPADEDEREEEEESLDRSGDSEAAKALTIMKEEFAIAEDPRHCQHLRHMFRSKTVPARASSLARLENRR